MRRTLSELTGRPWFAPASLAALIGILFAEFLFRRCKFLPYPGSSELLVQWRPYILYLIASLRAHEFPLWSHNLMAGFPLGAFPHAGMFYPPFLFFLLTNFADGFTLLVFFQSLCRVILVYGLLREWRCTRFAAGLGAATFGLAGFSLHNSGYLAMQDTLTWVPGIYWFALRLARRPRAADFLAVMFFSTLSYLGGELEILIFSWIILGVLIMFIVRPGWERAGLVAAALAGSLLICAAPLLLTENYLRHSFRGGVAFNPDYTLWRRAGGPLP